MSQIAVQNALLNLFKVKTFLSLILRSSFYDFCFTGIVSLLFLGITVLLCRPCWHMITSTVPKVQMLFADVCFSFANP